MAKANFGPTQLIFRSNADKIIDNLGRIRDRLPKYMQNALKQSAEIYAETIKQHAKFTFPRGSLKQRIKTKMARSSSRRRAVWIVQMPYYAWAVEYGRKAGRMPPNNAKIQRWARLAGMSPFYLRKTIAKHGTTARPFIRPGVRAAHRKAYDMFYKRIKTSITKEVKK